MEEREQFKNNEETILNLEELQERFDSEFEEYKNVKKEVIRKDFEKLTQSAY